jgi:hypothetical protein
VNDTAFQSFDAIALEALAILRSGVSVLQAYPILRQIEPLRVQRFGPSKWPGLLFRWNSEIQMFEVTTSEPHLDRHFFGEFNDSEVTKEEDRELSAHLATVLESWIRESRRQESNEDPWIDVALDDCRNRSTMLRHSRKGLAVRKLGRGRYQVRKSHLREFIKPQKWSKYGLEK